MASAFRHDDSTPPQAAALLRAKPLRRDSGVHDVTPLREGETAIVRGGICAPVTACSVVEFVSRSEYERRAIGLNVVMGRLRISNDSVARELALNEKDVRRMRLGAMKITNARIAAMKSVGVALRAWLAGETE